MRKLNRALITFVGGIALVSITWCLRGCLTNSGIDGGVFERNDEMHYVGPTIRFLNGDGDLRYFINPSLAIHLLQITTSLWGMVEVALGRAETFSDFVIDVTLSRLPLYEIGRGLTLGFAALGVALLAALGRRLFAPSVGVVAALLLATNAIHAQRSSLVGNEAMMVALVILFLHQLSSYVARPTRRGYFVAAFALGLAISAKYNAGVHVLSFALATLWVARSDRRGWRDGSIGVVGLPLGFVVGSPFVLIHPTRFLHDFRLQASYLTQGWVDRNLDGGSGHLAYLAEFPLWNNGLPAALLCGLGLIWGGVVGIRERRPMLLILSATSAATWLYLGRGVFHQARFLLPVTPCVLLLGAALLERMTRCIGSTSTSWRRGVLTTLLGVLLLLPGVPVTWEEGHRVFCDDDSRRDLFTFVQREYRRDEASVEFAYPLGFRLLDRRAYVTSIGLNRVTTEAQRRRVDRFVEETPDAASMQSLLVAARDINSLKARLRAGHYRRLFVVIPTEWLFKLDQLPRRVNDPAIRNCDYWPEFVRFLGALPREKTKVSHDRRLMVSILKLPQ